MCGWHGRFGSFPLSDCVSIFCWLYDLFDCGFVDPPSSLNFFLQDKRTVLSLRGHSQRVNCVRWFPFVEHDGGLLRLVSVSTDKSAIIWRVTLNTENEWCYDIEAKLHGHTDVVYRVAVGGCPVNSIASVGSDCSVRIWEFSEGYFFFCWKTLIPNECRAMAMHSGNQSAPNDGGCCNAGDDRTVARCC